MWIIWSWLVGGMMNLRRDMDMHVSRVKSPEGRTIVVIDDDDVGEGLCRLCGFCVIAKGDYKV